MVFAVTSIAMAYSTLRVVMVNNSDTPENFSPQLSVSAS